MQRRWIGRGDRALAVCSKGCKSGRFKAFLTFEQDMHQHIHKENNVLFPRAIELERIRVASNSSNLLK